MLIHHEVGIPGFYRGDVSAYKKPCSNQWGRSRDQRHG